MKKFRRNLFLFFVVLTLITVMFTSCPPNTPLVSYKTLTLDGKTTYYFLDGTWYDNSACETPLADLSLESKKPSAKDVTITLEFGGDEVTTSDKDKNVFFIKDENKFTFDFSYYTEEGKDTNYFVDGLKLPEDGIRNSTKLVSKYDTKEEKRKLPTLTGGTGSFEGYKLNGTGDNISAGEESEEISITANTVSCKYIAQWVPIYTLTLDETPSAYFKNGAWYSDATCETALKDNKVKVLDSITYKATLNLDNGSIDGNVTELSAESDFLGYFAKDASENAQALIGPDGIVSKYTISGDTDLVSKMSKAYYTKPENGPTRENYKFDGWQVNGSPYDFEKTEAKNGITIKALWKLIDEPTDEVSPTDVEAWRVALGNFIAPNTPYDFWSAENKQSLTAEQEKQVTIYGVSETVVYSSDSYTRAVQPLTSGYPTVGTVDAKVSGKYSNNKSFSLSLSIIMGEGGSSVTENKAIFIDGDKDPQELNAMILMNYMEGSSEGEIASEYKKPVALMKGVEFDYLDQVEKYIYNNKAFDVYSNVSGEKDIYEKGEIKESSVETLRFKSNGDITLTLNLTSDTEETPLVPLTINFDIQTVAGERTIVTASSYLNVKKEGEDFKKFPLDKLGYDIEGQ